MSENIAISVENVSKAYRIWNDPSARLKSPLIHACGGLLPSNSAARRKFENNAASYYRDFYALKDISFQVRKGESVGIIGRNGSGKSTLLQIIAGTLQPTVGSTRANGRVAALLELGSGFNPDFTGRENVYLNGATHGISRHAMNRLYEEICDFADIGDFINQPVRTYSTGMQLRLAFAVQTAIRPEILIVDEALAVGDAPFRTKCYARIRSHIEAGMSLLLVSHDIGTVTNLCKRALYLRKGESYGFGPATEVGELYREECLTATGNLDTTSNQPTHKRVREVADEPPNTKFALHAERNRKGSREVELINVWFETLDGQVADEFAFHDSIVVCQALRANSPIDCEISIGVSAQTIQGHELISGTDLAQDHRLSLERGAMAVARSRLRLPLKADDYYLRVTVWGFTHGPKYIDGVVRFEHADLLDWVEYAAFFRIKTNRRHSIYGPVHCDVTTQIH